MNNLKISFIIINNYLEFLIILSISIALSSFLILFSYLFIDQKLNSEKLSVYECGFEPYENSRQIFSIPFYLISIFFMIFDIEILFILPWCLLVAQLSILNFWIVLDFLFELCLGFFYIYYNNCLKWK